MKRNNSIIVYYLHQLIKLDKNMFKIRLKGQKCNEKNQIFLVKRSPNLIKKEKKKRKSLVSLAPGF